MYPIPLLFCAAAIAQSSALQPKPAMAASEVKLLRQFDFEFRSDLPKLRDYVDCHRCLESVYLPSISSFTKGLVVIGGGNRFLVYDVSAGRAVRTIDTNGTIAGVALSADGRMTAAVLCSSLFDDGTIRDCKIAIHDIKTGMLLQELRSDRTQKESAISAECRFTGSGVFLYNAAGGDICAWDRNTGRVVWSSVVGCGSRVSSDGKFALLLRSWWEGNTAPEDSLFDTSSLKMTRKWGHGVLPVETLSIDASRNGRYIVYGADLEPARPSAPGLPPNKAIDGTIGIFDTHSNKRLFEVGQRRYSGQIGAVPSVAITRDGRRVLACVKSGVVLLDGSDGKELCRFQPALRENVVKKAAAAKGLTPFIHAAFSESEKEAVVCDYGGRVSVWRIIDNEPPAATTGPKDVSKGVVKGLSAHE